MNVLDVIQRLDAVFGPLSGERSAGYFGEFQRQLGRYAGDVLAEAYAGVMDGWTKVARPAPALFREACERRSTRARSEAKVSMTVESVRAIRLDLRELVTRTLEYQALPIAAHAAKYPPELRWVLMSCIVFRIERLSQKGWIAERKPAPACIEFDDQLDWPAIRDHADTRIRCLGAAGYRESAFVTTSGAQRGITNRKPTGQSEGEPMTARPDPERPQAREIAGGAGLAKAAATPVAQNEKRASADAPIAKSATQVLAEEISAF